MSTTSSNFNQSDRPVLGFRDDIIAGGGKKAGDSRSSRASATDAALALSRLPVLGHFRKKVSLFLAVAVILVNIAALIGLVVYFRQTCTDEYGVLPNESGDFTPPALASLESQGGVTINSRTLVNYQTENNYTQLGQSYWTPLSLTCGCPDCNLASCAATIPIVVEYERCNPWLEAFALATGLLVYVSAALTMLFAVILCLVPCAKDKNNHNSTFWDFLVHFSDI